MKAYVFTCITLNAGDDLTKGFKKKRKDITEEELARVIKNCLESIRRKARAKKRNWKYIIYATTSQWHFTTNKMGDWHSHIIIYGSPSMTITKNIKEYWTSRGYGLGYLQHEKACWSNGFLRYSLKQQNRAFMQIEGITAEELREKLKREYPASYDIEITKKMGLGGERVTKNGFKTFANIITDGYTIADGRERCYKKTKF